MWGCSPSRSHLAFWIISLIVRLDLIPSWPQDPLHNDASYFTAEMECWITFWAGGNHNPDYGITKRSEIVKHHPFLTPPHVWPLLMLRGKRGRATARFLPFSSSPLQALPAPPEGQSPGLPGCYADPRVSPLPFVKWQGKIWPRKSAPVQAVSVPPGPAYASTNILCLKDSLGAIRLLAVVVVCRSFKRNHWFVPVSIKNKLQYRWRMRRSCVIFMTQH